MPIRGYIIEKYNTMTNAYTCNRLVQEASAPGYGSADCRDP